MKKNKKISIVNLVICCLFTFNQLLAQNNEHLIADSVTNDRINTLEKNVNYQKSGDDHILIVGLATFGFVNSRSKNSLNGNTTNIKSNSIGDPDHFEFSPMLLWRHGNKFLMEFEPSFSDNGLGVNWADASYFIIPNLTIKAGYFGLPYGTYSKRLAAGWINKLATDPMGVADFPTTDYGVELSGGLPLGSMKINYDVALSNGLQLMPDGSLISGNLQDNNRNKTVTARFGWLPLSTSSLELGASTMFGKVGTTGNSDENVKGNMYAYDLNYINTFNPFLINIKSQYNIMDISQASFISPIDSISQYSFSNHSTAGFVQFSIRPTGIKSLHDIELAARYTNYKTPINSTWGSNQQTVTVGLNYWLSWRAVAKVSYEIYKGNSTSSIPLNSFTGISNTNTFYIQFAIQL